MEMAVSLRVRLVARLSVAGGLIAFLVGCAAAPAASGTAKDAFGLEWKRYSDSHALDNRAIAEALDQPLLVGHNVRGYHASQLVVVAKAPFTSIRDTVRRKLQSQAGVEKEDDVVADGNELFRSIRPVPSLTLEERRAEELEEAGIDARQVRLYRTRSKPFNLDVVRAGASVINIQIIDASTLGAAGAIIFLQRVDRYEAFTNNWPHVVFPRWHQVSGPLVTEAERVFVEAVLHELENPRTRMYTSNDGMQNRDVLLEGIRWLKQ